MSDFLTLKGGEVDVGGAPEVISVLPFGHVVSQKGEFDVDEESLAAMKAQIAERGVDLVVDYEHQTLTGDRAPAAGWVKELFAEDGHIKARVEWTLPAKQYLENKEYRYLSPVITVRKSDNKATGLHSLALTNTPAIAGMTPIVNSSTFEGGKTNMNELIKKLAAALGLGEDAGEEQILEALSACIEENKALKEAAEGKKPGDGKQPPEEDTVVANKAVCELLGLKAGAPAAEVAAVIMSLKGGIDWLYYLRDYAVMFLLCILASTPFFKIAAQTVGKNKVVRTVFLAGVLLVSISFMVDSTYSPFLYFNF